MKTEQFKVLIVNSEGNMEVVYLFASDHLEATIILQSMQNVNMVLSVKQF